MVADEQAGAVWWQRADYRALASYHAVLKVASSWPIESALACSSKPGLATLTPERLRAMVSGLLKRVLRAMIRASAWPGQVPYTHS